MRVSRDAQRAGLSTRDAQRAGLSTAVDKVYRATGAGLSGSEEEVEEKLGEETDSRLASFRSGVIPLKSKMYFLVFSNFDPTLLVPCICCPAVVRTRQCYLTPRRSCYLEV